MNIKQHSDEKEKSENLKTTRDLSVPILIGHRGMGENILNENINYVENTIGSFLEARDLGAGYVEFDVQITKDRIPIIFHDFRMDGNLISEIESNDFFNARPNYNNTKSNDYNLNLDKKDRDIYINNYYNCSLQEAFKKCCNIGFNIEIKYPSLEEQKTNNIINLIDIEHYMKAILNVINSYNNSDIFYSSFSLDVCKYLMNEQKRYPVLYLIEDNFIDALEKAIQYDFYGVIINSVNLKYDFINNAHVNGKKLLIYGKETNDMNYINTFLQHGGDGVITDKLKDIKSAFAIKK